MGELNCPSPLPPEPHFVTNIPQNGSVLVVVLDDVLLVDELVLLDELLVLDDELLLVEVLVLDVVDMLVVVVDGGVGQPASAVGLATLPTTLNTLFETSFVGELVTAPPAGPPKA